MGSLSVNKKSVDDLTLASRQLGLLLIVMNCHFPLSQYFFSFLLIFRCIGDNYLIR